MNKELVEKIKDLKRKRKAVILVHNYQLPEVQDIADFLGDSLGLSIQASRTDADVIVFCGVYFMAETAKILSPHKAVLIPEKLAGCPMADMITAEELKRFRQEYPGRKVLCYVNTTAEVKAECDLCCTSANAVEVVNKAFKDEGEIIFVPDKYLGDYVTKKTGKKLILWDGYCPVHVKIMAEDIKREKEKHPNAEVVVHPECRPEVIELADAVCSTEGMVRYVKNSVAREFIIATEVGIIYRLKKENPDKEFYPATEQAVCENMKKINLEKVLWALEDMNYEITLPSEIVTKSQTSIERMLNL
jgi:quinolinate synthase